MSSAYIRKLKLEFICLSFSHTTSKRDTFCADIPQVFIFSKVCYGLEYQKPKKNLNICLLVYSYGHMDLCQCVNFIPQTFMPKTNFPIDKYSNHEQNFKGLLVKMFSYSYAVPYTV